MLLSMLVVGLYIVDAGLRHPLVCEVGQPYDFLVSPIYLALAIPGILAA